MGQNESCHAKATEMTSVQNVEPRHVGPGDVQSPKVTTSSFLPNLLPAKENVSFELAQKDAGALCNVETCAAPAQEEGDAHTCRAVLSEVQATVSRGASSSSLASAAVASAAVSADAARRKKVELESFLEQQRSEAAQMRKAKSAAWRRSQRSERNRRMQPCGIVAVEQLHWSAGVTGFSRWAPGEFTVGRDHYYSRVNCGGANPPLPYLMSTAHDAHEKDSSVVEHTDSSVVCREALANQDDNVGYREDIQSPKRSENPLCMSSVFSSSKVKCSHAAFDEVQSPKPAKYSRSSSRNSDEFRTSCEQLRDAEKPFVHTARKKIPRFHGSL
mmetsp:Transcript_14368/g.26155  ORF Transcript_14368/g.26155 Transcript_14368/m.26155 type:complete len:330 (+) Transcript_14368:24-1013(+)